MKRSKASGLVVFQAIPGLVDEYAKVMSGVWMALGRAPMPTEFAYFRDCLAEQLEAAFDDSPYSKVVVVYDTNSPPQTNLNFRIDVELASMESEYADWVANREPPLFGKNPDAKVIDIANAIRLQNPDSRLRILDVGAGTGRNTVPLAKLGYCVDACEPSRPLLNQLIEKIDSECCGTPVGLFEKDFLKIILIPEYYDFMFLSEVVSTHFRSINQLGKVFENASVILKSGGFLLFDVMLPKDDSYNPSDLVIQASEVNWSRVFTRSELRIASVIPSSFSTIDHRPSFELVSDESVLDYEKSRQEASGWPPTGWFEHWVQGRDAFDLPAEKCPYEMRWLCYRKVR